MSGAASGELSTVLRALSNPVRLDLLKALQEPTALSDIKLRPHRMEDGSVPKRPMSRASVQQHLKQLLEIGAVEKIPGIRDGRSVELYVVAASQMFVLSQELMAVARFKVQATDLEVTRTMDATDRLDDGGAGLALVNGVYEGRWFPLADRNVRDGIWGIGRMDDNAVALPFDPFVSKHQAEIEQVRGRLIIRACPGAQNPTLVDWKELGDDEDRVLVPGTVVSVGRSTLVVRL